MIDSVNGNGAAGQSGRLERAFTASSPTTPRPSEASASGSSDRVDAPQTTRARSLAKSLETSGADAASQARLATARAHLASGFFQSKAGIQATAGAMVDAQS